MTSADIKKWLKLGHEYEEIGSFIAGLFVVLVISIGVVQLLRHPNTPLIFSSSDDLTLSPTPVPNVTEAPVRKHVVQQSEGLWQVAEKYYQDGNQYQKIFEANKDKMRTPEDVKVGMELVIPQ